MRDPITQKHEFGCGVACVGYVIGSSYDDTVKIMNENTAKNAGFYCKDLVNQLMFHGFDYEYKYVNKRTRRQIYADGVIVFIKRSGKYPAGHYLVRSNKKWMDPWINFQYEPIVANAKSGFRKRLPGRPIYAILPKR